MKLVALLAFAMLGACSGTSPERPDAQLDANPSGHLGIHLGWVAHNPDVVPGNVGNSVQLARATFTLGNVRIIGDAATVLVDQLMLAWRDGMTPPTSAFVDSSPGIYSRLEFMTGFALAGTVELNGQPHPFTIHDDESLAVSVQLQKLTLAPGGEVDAKIRVDLGQVFDHLDFSSLPAVAGVLVLDANSAQIDEVRTAIREDTFSDANSGQDR